MDSDLRERAQTAWRAAQDEIERVRNLPQVPPSEGGGGALLIGDRYQQLRSLDDPNAELIAACGKLQTLVTQAEGASATDLPATEWNLSADVGALEAQMRDLRGRRESYQARWGSRE